MPRKQAPITSALVARSTISFADFVLLGFVLDEFREELDVQAPSCACSKPKRSRLSDSDKPIKVDVRIVAATNRNLWQHSKASEFREDLYFRLKTADIHIPPLRERKEDIEQIANDFRIKHHRPKLSKQQLLQLKTYHWHGNVRQLLNVLEKAEIFNTHNLEAFLRNEPDYDPQTALTDSVPARTPMTSTKLDDVIRAHCLRVYVQCDENMGDTAAKLGIGRNTLTRYFKKWGIRQQASGSHELARILSRDSHLKRGNALSS